MIYILLPAFNEERSLVHLVPKIHNYLTQELKIEYRIIACDDGSKDRTFNILTEQSKLYPITIIRHKLNRGLGETVRDLFEAAAETTAEGDIVVRMDCDDTHDPQF